MYQVDQMLATLSLRLNLETQEQQHPQLLLHQIRKLIQC